MLAPPLRIALASFEIMTVALRRFGNSAHHENMGNVGRAVDPKTSFGGSNHKRFVYLFFFSLLEFIFIHDAFAPFSNFFRLFLGLFLPGLPVEPLRLPD